METLISEETMPILSSKHSAHHIHQCGVCKIIAVLKAACTLIKLGIGLGSHLSPFSITSPPTPVTNTQLIDAGNASYGKLSIDAYKHHHPQCQAQTSHLEMHHPLLHCCCMLH
jgi:hypothetical protein